MHKCPECGKEYEGKFCPECGAQWQDEKVCPQCGALLNGSARFCNECGYSFAQAKNEEKKSAGFKQKLNSIGAWFKKIFGWIKSHLKIVIPTVAAIAVIITVTCVTVSVTSNKFRIAKVSKIELGYTQEQVLKVLGEPYGETKEDYKWEYYDGKYMDVLEKIAENDKAQEKAILSDNESKLISLVKEEEKLLEQLESITYKYIEVNFSLSQTEGNEKIYKVSSVYFDKARCDGDKEAIKEIKKFEISDRDAVSYYVDNTLAENTAVLYGGSEDKVYYSSYFTDGSYYKNYIYNSKSEISGSEITISWTDKYAKYETKKEAVKLFEIDSNGVLNNISRSITEITVPDSVTKIKWLAFENCNALTSATIGNGLTEISNGIFSHCTELTNINVSEENPVYHSAGNCIIETETKTLIAGCKGSVIPSDGSVTKIENYAFGSSGLTGITIPAAITDINHEAFYNCSLLTEIEVSDENPVYHSAGNCIIETETKTLIVGCKASIIPSDGSVTEIGYSAFEYCKELTSINIPEGVTVIGARAFCECDGLTSITVPDSVNKIGESAFFCYNLQYNEYDNAYYLGNKDNPYVVFIRPKTEDSTILTQCTVNNKTKIIYNAAFYNRSGLTKIEIPNNVTSIGDSAFYGCSGLTSITIPDGVTSIGGSAFSGCSSLTSITIPDSVTSIGDSVFWDCNNLVSVSIPAIAINSLPKNKLQTVIITSGENIGNSAFYGCNELTSITISDGVKGIGDSAFRGCSGLTTITVPDSVTSIGDSAFNGCSGLTSITIPDGVTSIGDSAFSGCSGLTSIIIPDTVTSIDWYAFEGCSSLMSITIPDGVTNIGGFAFSGCSNLVNITIPDGVTEIDSHVFAWCISLTSIIIPDTVTSIDRYAFEGCSSLMSITIPDGVTEIDSHVFAGCNSLTRVTIPDSVTSIVGYAFSGCSTLTDINFGGTKEQWLAIEKGPYWNEKTGKYTIHCTDGDISK